LSFAAEAFDSFEGLLCFKERTMMGVSPWMWAWMGVWLARTLVSTLLIGRIARTVIEKADVKDLPEVLAGLSVLAGALCTRSHPALQTAVSAETAAGDAGVREGKPAR
jgi:hypothetical protein